MKFKLGTILILCCSTLFLFAQDNGAYLQLNQDKFTNFHFLFDGENDTSRIDLIVNQKAVSFKFGLNKSLLKISNFSFNGDIGLRYFRRNVSLRHKFPGDNMTFHNDIDIESIFLGLAVSIQYRLKKFYLSAGYENEQSISRKLKSENAEFNFKDTDFADGFYKEMNSYYAKAGYEIAENLFIYLKASMYAEYQINYIPFPFANRIIDQSQYSIGLQLEVWNKDK